MLPDNSCRGCFSNKGNHIECPHCNYSESGQLGNSIYLIPGTIFADKYIVGNVLGQGGFGITYIGWDNNLNIRLAVKEYFPQGIVARVPGQNKIISITDHEGKHFEFGLDRFLREAIILAQFENHPNIVTVRDFFKANSTAYIIMSYIEGLTFEDYLIQQGGRIPYPIALDIMMPVMDALREVHKVDLMHRDISPDNILIDQAGKVILIDFGASRQEMSDKSKSMSVILKAGYAPEEQYRSRGKQGAWTDVYAVAATIYRAITGIKPPESMDRLFEDILIPPSQMGIDIKSTQEAVLLKGLAVRAKYRYQTMSEFQEDLSNELANYATLCSEETRNKFETTKKLDFDKRDILITDNGMDIEMPSLVIQPGFKDIDIELSMPEIVNSQQAVLKNKSCPYCLSEIIKNDDHIVCPTCEMPHHRNCWLENNGCTSYNCDNKESYQNNGNNGGYNYDDLHEGYLSNKLVVELEDLYDDKSKKGVFGKTHTANYKKDLRHYHAGSISPLFYGGFIAGLLTWLIAGMHFSFEYYASHKDYTMVMVDMMAFSAVMGGFLGLCLGAIEGITGKVPLKTFFGSMAGLVTGVIGASLGALIGYFVYTVLGGEEIGHLPTIVLLRIIFWVLVGSFIGWGQGLSAGGKEKVKNGLLGGIIGGLVGGMVFEILFILLDSPSVSAFVAIITFGICVALSIGVVQEYRKEAWLKVIQGATTGKEYIIQGNKTTIGSTPKRDIVLVRDPDILDHHADISLENNQHYIRASMGSATILLNGEILSHRGSKLKNKDKIRIGNYIFIFHEK